MAEQIATTLRRAIADGKLKPGTHLPEVQIAQEMGTSRAPLREALIQLEREGLVVRRPNRGTFVAELTEELVREVSSLRSVLEAFAAGLAVKRLTEEDFQYLETILKEMLAAARQRDFPRMVEWDYQFHEYILRASGHSLLHDTWVGMDGKIRVYLSTTNLMYADMKSVVEGHLPILQALRRRDPQRASRVMAEHVGEVLDLYLTKVMRQDLSQDVRRKESLRQAKQARRLAVRRLGHLREPRAESREPRKSRGTASAERQQSHKDTASLSLSDFTVETRRAPGAERRKPTGMGIKTKSRERGRVKTTDSEGQGAPAGGIRWNSTTR